VRDIRQALMHGKGVSVFLSTYFELGIRCSVLHPAMIFEEQWKASPQIQTFFLREFFINTLHFFFFESDVLLEHLKKWQRHSPSRFSVWRILS
jgi:hypothetical protein